MEWHTITLALTGPGLSRETLRGEFNRLGGIGELRLDFQRKRMRVEFDPARVTPGDVITAVKAAGYEATRPQPEEGHNGNAA